MPTAELDVLKAALFAFKPVGGESGSIERVTGFVEASPTDYAVLREVIALEDAPR